MHITHCFCDLYSTDPFIFPRKSVSHFRRGFSALSSLFAIADNFCAACVDEGGLFWAYFGFLARLSSDPPNMPSHHPQFADPHQSPNSELQAQTHEPTRFRSGLLLLHILFNFNGDARWKGANALKEKPTGVGVAHLGWPKLTWLRHFLLQNFCNFLLKQYTHACGGGFVCIRPVSLCVCCPSGFFLFSI